MRATVQAPAIWYDAVTGQGHWVEGGRDLPRLVALLVGEVMSPGQGEDVLLLDGPSVVAVIRGDSLDVFWVRPNRDGHGPAGCR